MHRQSALWENGLLMMIYSMSNRMSNSANSYSSCLTWSKSSSTAHPPRALNDDGVAVTHEGMLIGELRQQHRTCESRSSNSHGSSSSSSHQQHIVSAAASAAAASSINNRQQRSHHQHKSSAVTFCNHNVAAAPVSSASSSNNGNRSSSSSGSSSRSEEDTADDTRWQISHCSAAAHT